MAEETCGERRSAEVPYMTEIQLRDEVRDLRKRNELLYNAYCDLHYLCSEAADFDNGVSHQGMNEGRIHAARIISGAESAVAEAIKPRTGPCVAPPGGGRLSTRREA